MKVVIMAGGRGTRMGDATDTIPKPMIEIGNKPVLWHIMKNYAYFGCNEFIICLGYRGQTIRDYFLQYEQKNYDCQIKTRTNGYRLLEETIDDFDVTLVDTGLETQTGGRLKRIQKYLNNEHFMLTYGDGLANIDIQKLLVAHEINKIDHKSMATVTTILSQSRFGEIDYLLDKNTGYTGRATSFEEKSKISWINGGFFVFEPDIFDHIEGDHDPLEKGLLTWLAKNNKLGIYKHDEFWACMDTIKEVAALNELWDSGNPPWRLE